MKLSRPRPLSFQGEREAHDAEAEARADDHDVLRPQRSGERIVDEAETEIRVLALLGVAERPCMPENGFDHGWGETESGRAPFDFGRFHKIRK